MMYALVVNGNLIAVRPPGRIETKLSDGARLGPPDTGWTPELAALCGFVPVVEVARPADTPTHTHDRSVSLIAGVPTVVWTQRPKTQAELTSDAETANESSIRTKLVADMTTAQTVIDTDPASIIVTTFPQAQAAARDALRRDKDTDRMLKHLARLALRQLDGTD